MIIKNKLSLITNSVSFSASSAPLKNSSLDAIKGLIFTLVSVENPLFSLIVQPGIGELLTPSQPLNFHALSSEEPLPAPALGQNTEEILIQVLGLSDQQIGRLLENNIVALAD